MSTDTNPRGDEAEGRFALGGLVVAILAYAVLLCLSYL